MTDREIVAKGLECCNAPNNHDDCPYNGAKHYNTCTHRLLNDALELIQGQDPKVMTFDEARDHAMRVMNPDSIKPVFIEFREEFPNEEEIRPPWRGGYNQRQLLINQKDSYGIEFRFWTDRPSEEQKKAARWAGDA